MILIIISTLFWILYSLVDGYVQGYYYALYPFEKGHPNLHSFFVIQRGILLFFISGLTYFNYGIINGLILAVALPFMFSFFHNGMYYHTRHKIDKNVYPHGFFDQSDTSKAVIELGTKFRTAMAVMGLLFVIGVILDITT